MIKIVPPTQELVEAIAADMREADRVEVWASNHHTPLESLEKGWHMSDFAAVAVDEDGVALAMFGLVRRSILTDVGVAWALASNEAMKHRSGFLKMAIPVRDEMLTICPHLCNMVHGKNKRSIQWLKRLGFTIDDPVPYGPDGELFHRLHIERKPDV